VLSEAGLLEKLLPELELEFDRGRPANDASRVLVRALECAAAERLGLAPRFALITLRAPSAEAVAALAERLKAPGDCRDLAVLARRHAEAIARSPGLGASDLLAVLEHCDAFRRPERFEELLDVSECSERAARGWGRIPYAPRAVLGRALRAAVGVDAAAIASQGEKSDIAARVRRARIAAIEKVG